MVTEEQRMQLLSILALVPGDMDRIIAEMAKLGIKATPEMINDAINQLKQVKGE